MHTVQVSNDQVLVVGSPRRDRCAAERESRVPVTPMEIAEAQDLVNSMIVGTPSGPCPS